MSGRISFTKSPTCVRGRVVDAKATKSAERVKRRVIESKAGMEVD